MIQSPPRNAKGPAFAGPSLSRPVKSREDAAEGRDSSPRVTDAGAARRKKRTGGAPNPPADAGTSHVLAASPAAAATA